MFTEEHEEALAEYLREHRITKVLWIGSTTFFTSDDFMVED